VGTIRITEPGERAGQLVRCLRSHAQQYSIGVEEDPREIMVVDMGGHADDLAAFLRARLDVCARELGFGWRPYLSVQPTD